MPLIDDIQYIYSSPDFTGECLVKPLKLYHGYFVDHIENCQDCQKMAWIVANIATGIFAYTILGAVAAVGMAIKAIVSYSQYQSALNTIRVWQALTQALNQQTNQLSNVGLSLQNIMELAKQFPEWENQHRAALNDIEMLDLHHRDLNSLPEVICTLINLQELDLGQNMITCLPESIGQLTNLREINLQHTPITSLFKSLKPLSNLQQLSLTSFQEEVCQLVNLQRLYLKSICDITSFPETLGQLTNLQALRISHSQITSLPESIGNLTNLNELLLWHNQLTSVPESIGNLSRLQELDLESNWLTSLPNSISQLTNLHQLALSNNNLTVLPESLFQLTNLHNLFLRGNELSSLQDSFSKLINLQELDLSFFCLTSLSPVIGQLTSLQKLDVSANAITSIPDTIVRLSHLQELNISDNGLTDLSDFLAYLPATCRLNVENNSLSPHVIRTFRTQVAHVRNDDPTRGPILLFNIYEDYQPPSESVEMALLFWLNEYQTLFPKLCTDKQHDLQHYEMLLNHPEKDRLHRFLDKLKTVEDFREEQTRKALIYRVCQMLQWAADNASFREGCFANFVEALGECGDRITLFLNEIEILWHCSKQEKLSEDELIKLLVGVKRNAMLRTIAAERVNELGLGDAVEVHLFYQVNLKDDLALPVSAQGMLHEEMAQTITLEILAEDKSKILQATSTPEQKAAILVVNETWINTIKEKYKDQFEQINTKLVGELDQIPETLPEQQKLEKMKLLKEMHKEQMQEMTYNLTLEYFKGTNLQDGQTIGRVGTG